MMMYIMKHEKPQILHRIAAEIAGQLPDTAPADTIQSEELTSSTEMTADAKAARREYQRNYRERNREKLREYWREWAKAHPEQRKQTQVRYWQRQAALMAAQATAEVKEG